MQIRWASPSLGEEEERELLDAFRSGWISQGPKVKAFEGELAKFLGVKHAVALNNGTSALDAALKAIHIKPGDEVIIPAFTYIATANAVRYQNAVPVMVDVDPHHLNLDPAKVREAITPKTKCIIPIDYGGAHADYNALLEISEKYGIPVLQDGAHAIGGSYHGKCAGSWGIGATMSFHTAKVMTAVEGGAFITNRDDLAEAVRVLRNQGEPSGKKYTHPVVGNNFRMSDLHGAIALAQVRKLPWLLERRAEIVGWYRKALEGAAGVTLPTVPPNTVHPWFLFSILFQNRAARDNAEAALKSAGIETRICWPLPVYKQEAYREFPPRKPVPVSDGAAERNLTLPLHAALEQRHVDEVCGVLVKALKVIAR